MSIVRIVRLRERRVEVRKRFRAFDGVRLGVIQLIQEENHRFPRAEFD